MATPNDNLWAAAIIWVVRISTSLFILRNYIAPYVLERVSGRIRVRSISLRSIRGIYVRRGIRTWRVDRIGISYRSASGEGSSRFTVRIEGLKLEIGRKERVSPTSRKQKRRLTLADLSPSPLAFRLWSIMSRIYALLEPLLRPIIRTIAVASIRLFIRFLPALTQALHFDLDSAEVTFSASPHTRFRIKEATLHTQLNFSQLGEVVLYDDNMPSAALSNRARSMSMAALKLRLTKSFERTWERAWGKIHGAASVALAIKEVTGVTPSMREGSRLNTETFLSLPGAVDFSGSLQFNPSKGTVDPQSLRADLNMDSVRISVDSLRSLLSLFEDHNQFEPFPSYGSPPSATADSAAMSPSPNTPMSPFFEAFRSASRRASPRSHKSRIGENRHISWLSLLKSINVHFSIVTLTTKSKLGDDFEITIKEVETSIGLSNPDRNPLHRETLGRRTVFEHGVDAEVYMIGFSTRSVALDRTEVPVPGCLRVLLVNGIHIRVLASQWSLLGLAPSHFLSGDPNTPLLAIRVAIGSIEITERLEALQRLLTHTNPAPNSPNASPTLPSILSPVPRLDINIDFGSFRGRLLCAKSTGNEPFSVHVQTDGFTLTAKSRFAFRSPAIWRNDTNVGFSEHLPIQMTLDTSLELKPTFLRVVSGYEANEQSFATNGTINPESLGESALSLESVEIVGQGIAVGDFKDDIDSITSLDTSSIFFDLHCSSDALSIELWHPKVISAGTSILTAIRNRSKATLASNHTRVLDRLPTGLSLTLTLARSVLFVTGRDLNPQEDEEVTRGAAFKTGFSAHYAALRPSHVQTFRSLPVRSQTRHKLYLPEEQIIEAVAAAKSSMVTQQTHAFLRIALWDTLLRSAAATQYVADDPYIAERDDPALKSREFVHIRSTRVDIKLSGKRGNAALGISKDICQVNLLVPYIQGTFQLLHVYSLLLAAQTVQSILGTKLQEHHSPNHGAPSTVFFQFKATVKTLQLWWNLSTQKFVTRLDSISVQLSSETQLRVGWSSFLVWVPVLSRRNKWEDCPEERWEELIRLQKWNISLSSKAADAKAILVEGDSARLRIPFGFVLAHLILDLTVTVKCFRHLQHMVSNGVYFDMASPGPETAKVVPNFVVRIGCLFLEGADDVLESKLGLIWRAGFDACRQRLDREDAFKAKVATILAAETEAASASGKQADSDYQFSTSHTVSVEEAHVRLSMVHAVDWGLRLREEGDKRTRKERELKQRIQGQTAMKSVTDIPNLVAVVAVEDVPPLFRAALHTVLVKISQPSFCNTSLSDFMHDLGNGLPRDTQFSLLVPLHLNISLSSLQLSLRDYPIPLFDIRENSNKATHAFEFDTDLVVGEELATGQSVDWMQCSIVGLKSDIHGSKPMTINVPKTMMPVKSYASPIIRVTADDVTSFAWGVSYGATTQDLTRVLETISTPPRDSSPNLGFWDKIRLIFHWKIKVSFSKEVRLHLKGTRDPYNIVNTGAGFALCWQGHPTLLIGYENPDHELIQMTSESMLVVIPNLTELEDHSVSNTGASRRLDSSRKVQKDFRKICAKFSSGVRFGVGFVPERSCGIECMECDGSAFERKCRLFQFRPHFDVRLVKKGRKTPLPKSHEDSFNGFRSDFIHLSVSLTSALRPPKLGERHQSSSLHLSPKTFAHFWSWWALFEGVMSLPIRQGTFYPPRNISPKFGRHLATLKYRISVARLFISHAYIDDSRESWVDGVTPFVGVKAMIDKFQADMHQRDQESIVPGRAPEAIKVVRHKPFYAAEVVLDGLDLRTMMGIFAEPLKQSVDVTSSGQRSNYRMRKDLPTIETSSSWFDLDDFVETDWWPSVTPTVHLLQTVACSRLTYFKKNSQSSESRVVTSKFGLEDTHSCLLGKESSVPQVQISLASERVDELRRELESFVPADHGRGHSANDHANQGNDDVRALNKKISLLGDYISHLEEVDVSTDAHASKDQTYYMPSDTVSPDEWSEFDNVYQIHCPRIFMNNAIRDILMQYYHCSRGWRGLEYHMATRAVKFIRDQAEAAVATHVQDADDKPKGPTNSAQAAALALRKILTGDGRPSTSVQVTEDHMPHNPDIVDPLNGWSDGVSLRKSHFCLLLKPQIVLRSEANVDSVCVLAAVQAKLQSFAIMDDSNVEDPISGKIMTRSYTSLNGLQTFSPASSEYFGNGCVPLEVLIDYRCESSDFDRLVPQTDATFHYDKFNRLRLRNNVTSVTRTSPDESALAQDSHLHNETDLVQINVPRFTVSASDQHFQDISNILTSLILFSDAAHKTHMERLETLVFAYDFSDLSSAANVVADLQSRLRAAAETRREAEIRFNATGYEGSAEILQLKAHTFLLAEELNLLFDAIKLAQDRTEDETDQKSALLLNASASEISWRMLDDSRDLLAKLAMRNIDYSWLSRQDSSTVNKLAIGDLQAFDGSPHAVWPEILSKHHEPANHPLVKRELFILADWTVLAPVGGITIYESFELSLHPMRLQVDAKVGSRIMEYVWPARKHRTMALEDRTSTEEPVQQHIGEALVMPSSSRKSLDSSRALERPRASLESDKLRPPPLRRLNTSRSFTDLRSNSTSEFPPTPRSAMPFKHRTTDVLRNTSTATLDPQSKRRNETTKNIGQNRKAGDAAEMKTRSSQKTFILVKISSLHLVLSIVKEESFDLRDARIRTRDLEYRNQTWSFEELVDQFIPADMSWRGWVKMAFHQPLVPVLPVARELFSKTKWIANKGAAQIDAQVPHKPLKLLHAKGEPGHGKPSRSDSSQSQTTPHRRLHKKHHGEIAPSILSAAKLTAEPDSMINDTGSRSDSEHDLLPSKSRSRVLSMFHHASSRSRMRSAKASEGSSDSVPSTLNRERSDTVTPRSSPERPRK